MAELPAKSPLQEELISLCDDLARDIAAAGPVCEASGRCCRFKEYGHTLFLSRPEAERLLEEPYPVGSKIDEATCPYQVDGLCTAHERRPVGCRIYFCDPAYQEQGQDLSEQYIRLLKECHERHTVSWEYRPLHHYLRESRGEE